MKNENLFLIVCVEWNELYKKLWKMSDFKYFAGTASRTTKKTITIANLREMIELSGPSVTKLALSVHLSEFKSVVCIDNHEFVVSGDLLPWDLTDYITRNCTNLKSLSSTVSLGAFETLQKFSDAFNNLVGRNQEITYFEFNYDHLFLTIKNLPKTIEKMVLNSCIEQNFNLEVVSKNRII